MITEIKHTNLVAVEVPADASNYRFDKHFTTTLYWHDSNGEQNIDFTPWKCKILGTVTKDKIGFDVSKLPEMLLSTKEANDLLGKNDKINFYKLLEANGTYFENPMGEGPKEELFTNTLMSSDKFKSKINYTQFNESHFKWQSYEDKLVKGKLLIIEKI